MKYENIFDKDYQIVRVHPDSGEVHKITVKVDPNYGTLDFDSEMSNEVLWLIGYYTVNRFEDFKLYWCYELERGELFGGKLFTNVNELVQFYKWWTSNY